MFSSEAKTIRSGGCLGKEMEPVERLWATVPGALRWSVPSPDRRV